MMCMTSSYNTHQDKKFRRCDRSITLVCKGRTAFRHFSAALLPITERAILNLAARMVCA